MGEAITWRKVMQVVKSRGTLRPHDYLLVPLPWRGIDQIVGKRTWFGHAIYENRWKKSDNGCSW